MEQTAKHILIAGAAPDTGNHGVTALARGIFESLQKSEADSFVYFDHGQGQRNGPAWSDSKKLSAVGYRGGMRFYSRDHMLMGALRMCLGLGGTIAKSFNRSQAVLDVSGGDSFSDIYGAGRFSQIVLPKITALISGKPLILMPQTIGPFKSPLARWIAKHILSRATLVFTRDQASYQSLRALLGDKYDPKRHHQGIDLAFGMPAAPVNQSLKPNAVGINVSGLLWNDPESARQQFGLSIDYRWLITNLARYFAAQNVPIYLVPHVTPDNSFESDLAAARQVREKLTREATVHIVSNINCPMQAKGIIQQFDWFTGARMHATIAALSTATPVANMAYSDKAYGVFDMLNSSRHVVDLRKTNNTEALDALISSYTYRRAMQTTLYAAMPNIARRLAAQNTLISQVISAHASNTTRKQ